MQSGRWKEIFDLEDEVHPSSIRGINELPDELKKKIYTRLLPSQIFSEYNLPPDLIDQNYHDLLEIQCTPGSTIAEMSVYHKVGFPDPIIYGQITDTSYGQIHILFYVINDPEAPRFDIDRMPDGSSTDYGTTQRNIPEELKAMEHGLAPGQIRRGLRLMNSAIETFEEFSSFLGHDRFFAEPLFYHNAVILERAGFAYLKGRNLMEAIEQGFLPSGTFHNKLDRSTPFRHQDAAKSIRLRSWALHDGVMDSPFTGVTMYKVVQKYSGISTTSINQW